MRFLLISVILLFNSCAIHAQQIKFFAISSFLLLFILLIVAYLFIKNYKYKTDIILENQKKQIQDTLSELKNTQQQLIHAEKMASLGELTTGIAHEIQNPLNFINNFSEVNIELLEELNEQFNKKNYHDYEEITNFLKENLEKIAFHGKRADSIVKNMLLHSRKGTGEKEPVEINLLVDECLRLSYHGLRAKDKTFNANIRTDLDPETGKVNIITQDISRVLLNIFNNAFYSVQLKSKVGPDGYQPTVSVQTKKIGNEVSICIHDNGMGIPSNVLEKIYQPFFTTKPTGEGTGLGLSMSHEIITKGHNGKIQAKSEEGLYAEFDILLHGLE